jgi:ssDNA-binding Zn-finger/Zn-ribbon topoisomerase 1
MKCPKCGGLMPEKDGRYGRFLGCSNWPCCNGSRDLNPYENTRTNRPRRQRAGLHVIFPEARAGTLRRRETRPFPLSIYDPDDEETILDHSGDDRPDSELARQP